MTEKNRAATKGYGRRKTPTYRKPRFVETREIQHYPEKRSEESSLLTMRNLLLSSATISSSACNRCDCYRHSPGCASKACSFSLAHKLPSAGAGEDRTGYYMRISVMRGKAHPQLRIAVPATARGPLHPPAIREKRNSKPARRTEANASRLPNEIFNTN